MAQILSQDFKGEKYGITFRLVNEEDADVIIKLRTGSNVQDFLHQTSSDIDNQKEWIRNYKIREKQGSEYYFIYERNEVAFGVNRIYDIHDEQGTTGSWICFPGTSPIDILSSVIILYDIFFDEIQLKKALFETNKDNSSALRVNKALGSDFLYESGDDFYFQLLPEKYHSVCDKLRKVWHIK